MKILVIDDEPLQCDLLKGFLEKNGFSVQTAHTGADALQRFREGAFPLVLLDHRLPDMNGDEILERIKAVNPFVRSIMITAYSSVDTAVRVMKLGADDFLEKPVDLEKLLDKIRMISQSVMVEQEASKVADAVSDGPLPVKIIAESPEMKNVLSLIRRVAPTPFSVLIRGETGTGKELVARLIHLLSPRKDHPFVEVNCAAIPENLFESELFGHEKGSFTGANAARRGRFELANAGTLFLDEIGELPHHLQAKMLRVLQENKISRVGSEADIPVDVRVITATNRDLKSLVTSGKFREDLFYRLKVFDIEIPALRQRRHDIPALVESFMERYGFNNFQMDPGAMDALIKYAFPGNVRELEHIIQRTVTLARGSRITVRDLPEEVRYHGVAETGGPTNRLEAVEREMIMTALEKYDWNQSRAADSLGISERVLRYKMKKYLIISPKKF
ncbi:MAG: sigma-54-dependent Fis family transcriptional regulator [Desulfobacteraceae bacterium]|jgi:two-component system response regulator AtoC|nr:MAG: sigma-54-dependent Fis family transcriptional regulator [Desulfobacteraceae bacterium]